ncbi:MAG: putative rane protein [Rhodoferax sp.]|nr:putative rane protein [Rhodoferax sp.]
MHLVSMPPLLAFGAKHPAAKQALSAWCDEVRRANWRQPTDITAQFAAASILKNRRVVFNVKGNQYRIVAAVAYRTGFVYVKFIGSHTQYDAIDAETIEMA